MGKSVKVSNVPNAPAFSAYGSANQTIATSTYTKVAYNTEEYDLGSCYDHATNYRFTPNKAGKYQINAACVVNGASSGGAWIMLYKNGSIYKTGMFTPNSLETLYITLNCLADANGSTDYFEIFVWQNTGSNLVMGSSNARLSFSGFLAVPA